MNKQNETPFHTFLNPCPYHVVVMATVDGPLSDLTIREQLEKNAHYLTQTLSKHHLPEHAFQDDIGQAILFRSFKKANQQALLYLKKLSVAEQRRTMVQVLSIRHVNELVKRNIFYHSLKGDSIEN